ncbi:MAG: lamin tail domain-containing protein [Sedimentisphaerales bacterium]|nr:lamin tail domain-containing protein [Sedimentisphaerales bacterium]
MRSCLLTICLLLALGAAARAQSPAGDLNNDYRVDQADLVLFAGQWLASESPTADLNGDGEVNGIDLARLARHWGDVTCPIVINELLAHSHDDAPDWIELSNPSSIAVHVGGWVLSDDKDDLYKYQIPVGTIAEPNSYLVFYEDLSFGNPLDPNTLNPFKMSENGEGLYLYSGNDPIFPDYLTAETFGASETWVSFGRHERSTGSHAFVRLSEPTPDGVNAYPLVGPVIINEIMYHPGADGDAEYVELLNISGQLVTLFDFISLEPWRFTDDAGIELAFPADAPVTLQAGEHVLLVKDERLARATYPIGPGVQVFEWGSGKLANDADRIRLLQPGDLDDQGTRYWIEIDRVDYSDGSHGGGFEDGIDPWPVEADGSGLSLNRRAVLRYGDDPNNWEAAIPSPGSAND